MMYAKVIAAQTVNYLGYNILFQDVDIIWYKDPFTLFHDKSSSLHKFPAARVLLPMLTHNLFNLHLT